MPERKPAPAEIQYVRVALEASGFVLNPSRGLAGLAADVVAALKSAQEEAVRWREEATSAAEYLPVGEVRTIQGLNLPATLPVNREGLERALVALDRIGRELAAGHRALTGLAPERECDEDGNRDPEGYLLPIAKRIHSAALSR